MAKKIMLDFSKATGEEVIEKTHKEVKKQKNHAPDNIKQVHKPRVNAQSVTQILGKRQKKSQIFTKSGRQLTVKEAKFIDAYIATGNQRKAVIQAGYEFNKDHEFAGQLAQKLLSLDYITEEISDRMNASKDKGIADRQEIMQFFTDMMRGKILDQFDLPTTNGDKIKAACELAKRSIDFEDRLKEKRTQTTAPEVKISLKWEGRDEEKK